MDEMNLDIFSPVSFNIADAGNVIGNFKKIEIGKNQYINMSTENYLAFTEMMLSELTYIDKIAMINHLVSEVGEIIDSNESGWKLGDVYHDQERDKPYFNCDDRGI